MVVNAFPSLMCPFPWYVSLLGLRLQRMREEKQVFAMDISVIMFLLFASTSLMHTSRINTLSLHFRPTVLCVF
jgi:hypothetical protein